MIVVTGGAGLIGSAVVNRLNELGEDDILIVDHLSTSEKWKNLVPLRFADYLDRDQFIEKLENNEFESIGTIFHLGACSATTEKDASYLMENNYRYTLRIAQWIIAKSPTTRFIYASSAATYGSGENGYIDDESQLETLRPLNMYGYSKQLFDLKAKREGWLNRFVGLKYFNVYGPNENHKGSMRSLINKAFTNVHYDGKISLFMSHVDEYEHGEQQRDFIYVKDAVEMTLFFWKHREHAGIFNIGTGTAHSWNDVARAMFNASNRDENITYIPMPEELQGKYQNYTCADMSKLKALGADITTRTLEEAINDYFHNYLIPEKNLGDA